ncbi:MAG: TrkA family potassium uptake protein [Chloroflexota bacterium]
MTGTVQILRVAVLGLGRFGASVATELTALGHDVLGVDSSARIVQSVAASLANTAQADATSRDALEELNLGRFDAAVVAITGRIDVSIMATLLCAQFGVPRIIAKAADPLHASILEKVGATHVVSPERESGRRLAQSVGALGVPEYLDAGPGYGVARLTITGWLDGATLRTALQGAGDSLQPVAVVQRGRVALSPPLGARLATGDVLVVAGPDEQLSRLAAGQ